MAYVEHALRASTKFDMREYANFLNDYSGRVLHEAKHDVIIIQNDDKELKLSLMQLELIMQSVLEYSTVGLAMNVLHENSPKRKDEAFLD